MNALSTNAYHRALVGKVVQETPTVTTIYFTVHQPRYAYTAGQYISVYFADLNNGVGKAYSLSSIPSDPMMSITVKNIGVFSQRICLLSVGDTFLVSPAFGFFNAHDQLPIVAIVAGVGIAPVWSIIRDMTQAPPTIPITLFYTAPTAVDLVFKHSIDALVATSPAVQVRYFVTREVSPGAVARRLCIAQDMIVQPVPCRYYVCGSEAFVGSMWTQLMQAGVNENAVVTEIFFEASV